MDIQPQLFRAAPEPQGLNRPLAELPLERQVDLLGQQMMQLQQLLAMQQMQLAAGAHMQAGLEVQSMQLQAIALETNQAANARIANTEQALIEKTKECLAKDAEIAILKAQLAGQQAAHVSVNAAAEQTIDTQGKTISNQKEEIAILSKAFETTEKAMNEYLTYFRGSQLSLLLSRQGLLTNFNSLPSQVKETREKLQQNIQNKTP